MAKGICRRRRCQSPRLPGRSEVQAMGAGIWRVLPLGHYVDAHFRVENTSSISLLSSRRRR